MTAPGIDIFNFVQRFGYQIAAACFAVGVITLELARSYDRDFIAFALPLFILGLGLGLYAFVSRRAHKQWVRRSLVLRMSSPIPDGIVNFDYLNEEPLQDVAAQKGVERAPSRTEMGKGETSSRQAGLAGQSPISLQAGTATSHEKRETFEHTESSGELLRKVVNALTDGGELNLELGSIPAINADRRFKRDEIEEALRAGVEERLSKPKSKGEIDGSGPDEKIALDPGEIADLLTDHLAAQRLVGAKSREIESLQRNDFVLLDGEWNMSQGDEESLKLLKLQSGRGDWGPRSIAVPKGIDLSIGVSMDRLVERARESYAKGPVNAWVFGQVATNSRSAASIWPIAIFSVAASSGRWKREATDWGTPSKDW